MTCLKLPWLKPLTWLQKTSVSISHGSGKNRGFWLMFGNCHSRTDNNIHGYVAATNADYPAKTKLGQTSRQHTEYAQLNENNTIPVPKNMQIKYSTFYIHHINIAKNNYNNNNIMWITISEVSKQDEYMRCSDVSQFEHIYGQIFTTPSCVYDRLFTWTVMVDFNAVIVWKTLIDICFSVKSSLWALAAAYTKFRRMMWSMIWSCGHRSRSPMCTVLLPHRKAGRLYWGKAESIQLCDFRVGQAITGPEVLI